MRTAADPRAWAASLLAAGRAGWARRSLSESPAWAGRRGNQRGRGAGSIVYLDKREYLDKPISFIATVGGIRAAGESADAVP